MTVIIRLCVVASLWSLTEVKFYGSHHMPVCCSQSMVSDRGKVL